MMKLCKAEISKLLRPWHHRLLILFVLCFPFLQMSFTMLQEAYGNRVEKDAIHEEIKGIVNEQWLHNRAAEISKMEMAGIDGNDIRYVTIKEAYFDGFRLYQKREYTLQDPSAPLIIKEDFTQHPLQYGPYEDWLLYFNCFSMSGLVFAVACIYLFCNLFNQEEESGAIDLIKSSKNGRKPLAFAKIGLCAFTCIALGIGVYAMVILAGRTNLTLLGSDTTLLMLRVPQYLTCGMVEQLYIGLIVLAGCICGLSSAWISSLTKRMHISLSLGFIFFILPYFISISFFDTPWEMYFPVSFVERQRSLIYYPWLKINTFYEHNFTLLTYVWIPLLTLLVTHTIWYYCKQKQILPIRKLRKIIWN